MIREELISRLGEFPYTNLEETDDSVIVTFDQHVALGSIYGFACRENIDLDALKYNDMFFEQIKFTLPDISEVQLNLGNWSGEVTSVSYNPNTLEFVVEGNIFRLEAYDVEKGEKPNKYKVFMEDENYASFYVYESLDNKWTATDLGVVGTRKGDTPLLAAIKYASLIM